MTDAARKLDGKCLCGAVRFTVSTRSGHLGACHCSMCRTWSGGVLFALEDAQDLVVAGTDSLAVYTSSDWGERCFCKVCGSNLFWRSPALGHTAVMAGALADTSGLTFTTELFVDHRAGFFEFANATRKWTEAEFLAQFAPKET